MQSSISIILDKISWTFTKKITQQRGRFLFVAEDSEGGSSIYSIDVTEGGKIGLGEENVV